VGQGHHIERGQVAILYTVKKSSLQKKFILTNVDEAAILQVERPPFCIL
jgi:hypothetical protein